MAKIQFDIKFRPQIESGEYKVETTKGQPVRIICWDRGTTYWKIIGLVLAPDGKTENPFTYDANGKESDGCLHNHEFDLLIIIPKEEMTPFEKELTRVIGFAISRSVAFPDEDMEAFVKSWSGSLLSLAREQLIEEEYTADPRKTDLYKLGKTEALKDLPRWEKIHPMTKVYIPDGNKKGVICDKLFDLTTNRCISLSELKKLPGFKEDGHE